MSANYCGIPFYYDYQNAQNSTVNPSTVHIRNTGLQRYFSRYLLQKIISVFEWTMPETWARNYTLYVLYCWGFFAVINTDKFGVIPQNCTLGGFDVFYQPKFCTIANPLLQGIKTPVIGAQCELVKLQPDYGGVLDIVNFYADMLALSAETAGTDLLNCKLAYVFTAKGKAPAESFKKLFDQIASGEPASVTDKNLYNEDGSPNWQIFNQNLKETYIAGDILEDMRLWEMKFDNEIGIPTTNTMKKERLVTDEAGSAIIESRTKAQLWLDELQNCCRKVNNMFGINLWVDWRKGTGQDASDIIPNGSV